MPVSTIGDLGAARPRRWSACRSPRTCRWWAPETPLDGFMMPASGVTWVRRPRRRGERSSLDGVLEVPGRTVARGDQPDEPVLEVGAADLDPFAGCDGRDSPGWRDPPTMPAVTSSSPLTTSVSCPLLVSSTSSSTPRRVRPAPADRAVHPAAQARVDAALRRARRPGAGPAAGRAGRRPRRPAVRRSRVRRDAPVSRGRPRKRSRLLLHVPPRLRKMCPPGVETEPTTPHNDPYALSESRDELLIHVRALLAAADVDPRAVETEAAAAVAAARRRKDPEILGLSLRVLAMALRARWTTGCAPAARRGRARRSSARAARRWRPAHSSRVRRCSRSSAGSTARRATSTPRSRRSSRATDVDAGRARPGSSTGSSCREPSSSRTPGWLAEAEARYRALLDGRGQRRVHRHGSCTTTSRSSLAERGAYDEALEQADDAVAMSRRRGAGFLGPVAADPGVDRGPGRAADGGAAATSSAPPRPTRTRRCRWASTTTSTPTR